MVGKCRIAPNTARALCSSKLKIPDFADKNVLGESRKENTVLNPIRPISTCYSGIPSDDLPESLIGCLPSHKSDLDSARAAITLGYPGVAQIVTHLLTWMQDYNWPVAQELAPFLAGLGAAILPEVRQVLQGDDEVWTYWTLRMVVAHWSRVDQELLRGDLEILAQRKSEEGVDEEAQEILGGLI